MIDTFRLESNFLSERFLSLRNYLCSTCLVLSDYRGISIIVPSIINYRPARRSWRPKGHGNDDGLPYRCMHVCLVAADISLYISPFATSSSTVTLLLTTLYNAFNQEKPGETVV